MVFVIVDVYYLEYKLHSVFFRYLFIFELSCS